MKPVARPNTPHVAHLLPWESEGDYAARLDDLITAYAPVGPIERAAVERIAHIMQRLDRLALAERAVHMMGLHDATAGHVKRLARRAQVAPGNIDAPEHVATILALSEADDANDLAELTRNRAATDRAQAILEAGRPDAYERALAVVDADTREAWRQRLEIEEGCEPPEYVATPESFAGFLEREIAPWEAEAEQGITARPALRLQATGESFAPDRMERLLAIDSRLAREFERAVGLLVKLQEVRLREPEPAAGNGAPLVEGGAPRSGSRRPSS